MSVLRKNEDIFAWGPEDIPRVALVMIEHKLTFTSTMKPKKQNLQCMSTDRQESAKADVTKLLKNGVIREIKHPEWLANPMLVRKVNDNGACAWSSLTSTRRT